MRDSNVLKVAFRDNRDKPMADQVTCADAQPPESERAARRFRTDGVFDGEPDLGREAKEIVRRELG